jgi:hypothetical protein
MTNGQKLDMRGDVPERGANRGTLTLSQLSALGLLALAHFFDYASFLVLISHRSIGAEANPVVVRILSTTGLGGLTLAKVATVAFAALLIILVAPHHRRLSMFLLVFGVAAGLIGGVSNVASM